MKIAIFDTTHFEVVHTLIHLFDAPENEITIFIYPEAQRQLLFLLAHKADRYNWVVREKEESNRRFIKRSFRHLNDHSFDLLYFNTISDNFIVFAYYLGGLKHTPTILTLHDINGHFQYKPSLSLVRLVRYIGKRFLIKRFHRFNVLAESMVDFLQKKLPAGKQVFSIPGGHFVPEDTAVTKLETGYPVKIVVPGSVDERRRDYTIVRELLVAAERQHLSIEICLLGAFSKEYGRNTYQFCREYLQQHSNLKIFEEDVVDQPEFDKQISESHFILMPVQPQTSIADGIIEEYGKTICSGNIGDVIRHAKPFFVPRRMPLDDNLKACALQYETVEDILAFVKQLSPEAYGRMQMLSRDASLYYTKEKIIGRNAGLFRMDNDAISKP